jgi:hypothetical protein
MKLKLLPFALLLLLMTAYALSFPLVESVRKPLYKVQARGMILPPLVTKMLTLEFKSVAADILFARASQYFGGKIATRTSVDNNDMRWLYQNLLVITDLDPCFEDPYYFGNALFTWEVGMFAEANSLLKKGAEARSWDWQLPFYLGFNKFYFLHEYKEAADYLLVASRRPGAYEFLPTLAARLYNREGGTETAIVFLKVFIENTRDERIRKNYEIRLDAFKKILYLERAVTRYRSKTGKLPGNLDVLIQSGIIPEIPRDPYGGVFYLEKDGSVQTTSKLAFLQNSSNQEVVDQQRK